MERVPKLRRWSLRLVALSVLAGILLALSTLWGLYEFQRTKNLYPQLTYRAPSYRPDVNWTPERPANWVSLEAMPRAAWLSVIAAEDGGFFRHEGVEWEQSLVKIRSDLEKGRFPSGISTLNQQLAKNLYFGARPALTRKVQEAFVARRMDAELEKKRILEIYMNIAEWGPGVVGIRAAAKYYFRKKPQQLSDRECAILANLLPNPRVRGEWVLKNKIPRTFQRSIRRTLRRLPFTWQAVSQRPLGRR